MVFPHRILPLASLLLVGTAALPQQLTVGQEAIAQADTRVHWRPEIWTNSWKCPDGKGGLVYPDALEYSKFASRLDSAARDWAKGHKQRFTNNEEIKWENIRCDGKTDLLKFDAEILPSWSDRSPYRLIFRVADGSDSETVIAQFCGVVAHVGYGTGVFEKCWQN